MLEDKIEQLTVAINRFTDVLAKNGITPAASSEPAPVETERKKPGPKPKKEKAEAAAEDGGVTLDVLREKGMSLVKAKRSAELKEMLTEYGSENITGLDKQHYEAVNEKLDELLAV